MIRRLNDALSFLTILRVPFLPFRTPAPEDFPRSFAMFPAAGLVVGAVLCLSGALLSAVAPPLLAAALLVTLLALITRGFHLDGLSDCADGLGGGHTPERRLAIMKDSRVGAFGVIGVACVLLVKTAAIAGMLEEGSLSPLLFVPALSRLAMAVAARGAVYARPEGGLGRPFLSGVRDRDLVVAGAVGLGSAALLAPAFFLLYGLLALLCVALWRVISSRMLGGMTGDVFGAVNETAEAVLFALAACLE